MFFREADDAVNIRGGNGNTLGVPGNAAVARQGVDGICRRVFFQLADDGVFPPAAAYD